MLRTKGEAGTGNVVEAVRHARSVQREIRMVSGREERNLRTCGPTVRPQFAYVLHFSLFLVVVVVVVLNTSGIVMLRVF